MKKTSILTGLAALLLVFQACNRTLEVEPLERINSEYLWDTDDSVGQFARQYLDHVYAALPDGHNRLGGPGGGTGDRLATASDDAMTSEQGSIADQMTTGGLTPLFNPDDSWIKCYEGIRKATIFLVNFPKVPMKDEALQAAWMGEARFIRAFFYFELLKRYGGVPLMGDKVRGLDDDLEIPRRSVTECIDYINSGIDASVDGLRSDQVNPAADGRVPK